MKRFLVLLSHVNAAKINITILINAQSFIITQININSILVTNIIFAFFPLSFILGNLITNINLILFCGLGIFHLKSKILTNKFNLPLKIIFLLFLIILDNKSWSVNMAPF